MRRRIAAPPGKLLQPEAAVRTAVQFPLQLDHFRSRRERALVQRFGAGFEQLVEDRRRAHIAHRPVSAERRQRFEMLPQARRLCNPVHPGQPVGVHQQVNQLPVDHAEELVPQLRRVRPVPVIAVPVQKINVAGAAFKPAAVALQHAPPPRYIFDGAVPVIGAFKQAIRFVRNPPAGVQQPERERPPGCLCQRLNFQDSTSLFHLIHQINAKNNIPALFSLLIYPILLTDANSIQKGSSS